MYTVEQNCCRKISRETSGLLSPHLYVRPTSAGICWRKLRRSPHNISNPWKSSSWPSGNSSSFLCKRKKVSGIADIWCWSCWSSLYHRFSVLPAISLSDGVLHCNVLQGSFCTETFKHFISEVLDKMQPYPAPNSVLVLDNCKIHKDQEIQAMIEAK
jgi:hypothetical protein